MESYSATFYWSKQVIRPAQVQGRRNGSYCLIGRVAKSPCRRMSGPEGNVPSIFASNLAYTPSVCLSCVPQIIRSVPAKPYNSNTKLSTHTLNAVIWYGAVDSGSHIRGNVKAKAWELVDRKSLFNLEEANTQHSVIFINPMIFFLNSCCHLE